MKDFLTRTFAQNWKEVEGGGKRGSEREWDRAVAHLFTANVIWWNSFLAERPLRSTCQIHLHIDH